MSGDGLCNGINASGEGEGDAYDVDCGATQRAMHSTIRARKQLMKMTPASNSARAIVVPRTHTHSIDQGKSADCELKNFLIYTIVRIMARTVSV